MTGYNHMKPIAIQCKNISKEYTIHHEKPTFIERVFKKDSNEKFSALSHISLTVKKGDKIGIIGPNGAGKTTLLKIISGITTPTRGKITRTGKIISLIDLEAGFHPDLTGIQNIYINGLLLGMPRQTIENNLRSIIDFAGIHKFIDVPLFTYSMGMKLRLGFAIAIHADPEILIIDESFGVGDESFYKKAKKSIDKLFQKNTTIIIVSHHMNFIKKYAKKILLLENGRIQKVGNKTLIKYYLRRKYL